MCHAPERRAAGLLDMVEEDDGAVGQRAAELGRAGSRQQQWEQEQGHPHPPGSAVAASADTRHALET